MSEKKECCPKYKERAMKRFITKVTRQEVVTSPHVDTPCWIWNGFVSGSGYGEFWYLDRIIPAHRFLLKEQVKSGAEACHKCDNRTCVNPDHIFIGTRTDNMRDCAIKGRSLKGEKNRSAKLTNEAVAAIKGVTKRYGVGVKMARHFGVSQSTINSILTGQRWSHIQPDIVSAQALLKAVKIRASALLEKKGTADDE